MFLHHGDLSDVANLLQLVSDIRLHMTFKLVTQLNIGVSVQQSENSTNADALDILLTLYGARSAKLAEHNHIYQACNSDLSGNSQEIIQKE